MNGFMDLLPIQSILLYPRGPRLTEESTQASKCIERASKEIAIQVHCLMYCEQREYTDSCSSRQPIKYYTLHPSEIRIY